MTAELPMLLRLAHPGWIREIDLTQCQLSSATFFGLLAGQVVMGLETLRCGSVEPLSRLSNPEFWLANCRPSTIRNFHCRLLAVHSILDAQHMSLVSLQLIDPFYESLVRALLAALPEVQDFGDTPIPITWAQLGLSTSTRVLTLQRPQNAVNHLHNTTTTSDPSVHALFRYPLERLTLPTGRAAVIYRGLGVPMTTELTMTTTLRHLEMCCDSNLEAVESVRCLTRLSRLTTLVLRRPPALPDDGLDYLTVLTSLKDLRDIAIIMYKPPTPAPWGLTHVSRLRGLPIRVDGPTFPGILALQAALRSMNSAVVR